MQQLQLALIRETDYGSKTYCVGPYNETIYKGLFSLRYFICLCGPRGSGKTHLAHIWAQKNNAIWITKQENWHEVLDQSDYFVIDAVESCDAVFLFHLYNAIYAQKKHLLIISQIRPSLLNVTLPDLKSRLATFHVLELTEPDDQTLLMVLTKMLQDKGVYLKPSIARYLLRRVERSFASMLDLAQKMDKLSVISMHTVQGILK